MSRTVVVLTDFFLPAVKAGGPVRSLAALVHSGVDGRILVITRDRDLGDSVPFPDVPTGRPVPVSNTEVVYVDATRVTSVIRAWRTLRAAKPDSVYLNSFFAPISGLLPLLLHRVGLLHRGLLIVAPRGQLDPGALTLSAGRKRVVLGLLKLLRATGGVRFHATSELERDNIRRALGPVDIRVLEPAPTVRFRPIPPNVERGPLRLVYLSRISPKKGLLVALEALREVDVPMHFDVYGPEEDPDYSRACRRSADDVRGCHEVRFHGVVPHEQVSDILERADAFILPTLGENFGHVILEALAAGCPSIVGEATPWTRLLRGGAGWVVDATSPESVAAALRDLSTSTATQSRSRSQAAVQGAREFVDAANSGAGWDSLLWH